MDDHSAFWEQTAKAAEARCQNQQEHIQAMRYAGNELARVLDDVPKLGHTHGLVQVDPVVELHQGKELHRRLRAHWGIRQVRYPGQPLTIGAGDFVKQP